MPVTANLDGLYQGDDFATSVQLLNEDGSPFDLTNCTARAQMRQDFADDAPVAAQFVIAFDAVVQGAINLSLPGSLTTPLSGNYVWDMQLTDPDGAITTVISGMAPVTPEVTR